MQLFKIWVKEGGRVCLNSRSSYKAIDSYCTIKQVAMTVVQSVLTSLEVVNPHIPYRIFFHKRCTTGEWLRALPWWSLSIRGAHVPTGQWTVKCTGLVATWTVVFTPELLYMDSLWLTEVGFTGWVSSSFWYLLCISNRLCWTIE